MLQQFYISRRPPQDHVGFPPLYTSSMHWVILKFFFCCCCFNVVYKERCKDQSCYHSFMLTPLRWPINIHIQPMIPGKVLWLRGACKNVSPLIVLEPVNGPCNAKPLKWFTWWKSGEQLFLLEVSIKSTLGIVLQMEKHKK